MKYFNSLDYKGCKTSLLLPLDNLSGCWKFEENGEPKIRFRTASNSDLQVAFQTQYERDHTFEELGKLVKNEVTEKSFMKELLEDIKSVIKENKNIIYSIVGIIIVDQVLLKGQLSARIQAIFEKLLGKVESKMGREQSVIEVETKKV